MPLLKTSVVTSVCLVLLAVIPALCAERDVVGTVFYKGGEPAADAAVELEDRSTLQVMSRRTDHDGHFKFDGLSPDKDYAVRATKNGYWSKTYTVSHFSSRPIEKVTLYLVPTRDGK
ncbi:MAG: carboxypeptidase-like regulatory domain-containing protein [Bryobacteraceae bacterium]